MAKLLCILNVGDQTSRYLVNPVDHGLRFETTEQIVSMYAQLPPYRDVAHPTLFQGSVKQGLHGHVKRISLTRSRSIFVFALFRNVDRRSGDKGGDVVVDSVVSGVGGSVAIDRVLLVAFFNICLVTCIPRFLFFSTARR